MSIEDIAKPLLNEVKGSPLAEKQSPANGDHEVTASTKKPEPNKLDPEEVQYPGYFKDGGSL